MKPHIRLKITARWGLKLVGDVDLGDVTVTQPNIYADPWPTVRGDVADYHVRGEPLARFEAVQWWGYLGEFSVPKVPALEVAASNLGNTCLGFLIAFREANVKVPGWPLFSDSFPDDADRNSLYAGSIGLEFGE